MSLRVCIVAGRSTRSLAVMRTSGEPAGDLSPDAIVESFIAAMNAWEIEAAAVHRRAKEAGLTANYNQPPLEEIFRRHCTPRDRPEGRLKGPSFQRPPEYNPTAERVAEVTVRDERVAMVETLRTAVLGGGRYRYTLHRHNGRWLIDNVMRLSGSKWKRGIL